MRAVLRVVQVEIAALRYTQEEADTMDTKILLHVAHAAGNSIPHVVIRSPDNDVAVIALRVSHQIDTQLICRTGTQPCTRCLDLTTIGRELGQEMCNALPGYHAFIGCDSTSAFTGRGGVPASDY